MGMWWFMSDDIYIYMDEYTNVGYVYTYIYIYTGNIQYHSNMGWLMSDDNLMWYIKWESDDLWRLWGFYGENHLKI